MLNTENITKFYEIVEEYDLQRELKEKAKELEALKNEKDNNIVKFGLISAMDKPTDLKRTLQRFEGYKKIHTLLNKKESDNFEEVETTFHNFRKKLNKF